MAKLREAKAYRRIKRPYTRKSKYRKHSFVKGVPGSKIIMFDMGNKRGNYPYKVNLIAKKDVNLRHNAIEASRIAATKYMTKILGKQGYHLKLRVYPHHVMRENPLATGAGADRMQQGMRHAFGKPIGAAAQVKEGKIIITAYVNEKDIKIGKEALRKAASKYPISCNIEVIKAT